MLIMGVTHENPRVDAIRDRRMQFELGLERRGGFT